MVDSIVKNIPMKGNYRDNFAREIVPIFLTVFKEVLPLLRVFYFYQRPGSTHVHTKNSTNFLTCFWNRLDRRIRRGDGSIVPFQNVNKNVMKIKFRWGDFYEGIKYGLLSIMTSVLVFAKKNVKRTGSLFYRMG